MQKLISLSRRNLLAAGATGAVVMAASAAEAASFGNPDEPAEGAANVVNPKALSDPGPQDPNLAGNEPAFLNPRS
jgi:oxalate decarboxylase